LEGLLFCWIDGYRGCGGVLDLDLCSDSWEIPNVPVMRYFTVQDKGLVQLWKGRISLIINLGLGSSSGFCKLYAKLWGDGYRDLTLKMGVPFFKSKSCVVPFLIVNNRSANASIAAYHFRGLILVFVKLLIMPGYPHPTTISP